MKTGENIDNKDSKGNIIIATDDDKPSPSLDDF